MLTAVGTVALSGIVGGGVGWLTSHQTSSTTPTVVAQAPVSSPVLSLKESTPVPAATQSYRGDVIADVAEHVAPSVVQLRVSDPTGNGGSGSGFVIRDDGYIVTNAHVALAAGPNGQITVVLPDGTTLPGTLVGSSSDYDLAVVKIEDNRLPPVLWANLDDVKVGSTVIALGSPLGLQGTVTSGIVSALNRPVIAGTVDEMSFISAIQTDAAINPGNSGGPLVDTAGRVVGVNSAIASLGSGSSEQGSIGLGFAIPSRTAERVVNELISTGKARTPWIGVNFTDALEPATVSIVGKGSPGEQAGLRAGDVITRVGRVLTPDVTSFIVALREHAVGDHIDVTVKRDGETLVLPVKLAEAPA